jgi:uncharacterized glyoxalase superfamily protein PhnB
MKMATYLVFNGACKGAFEYYARVLGGRVAHGYPRASRRWISVQWKDQIIRGDERRRQL